MNTDDILGRLRDRFPGQMVPIDAVLFRAGYARMGQVRALLIDRIPNSINFFRNDAKKHHSASGHSPAARRRRV
jgi:hypothetical protein